MKARITICIERPLLERIDGTRGLISRSAWIEDHLKKESTRMNHVEREVSACAP